MGKFIYYVLVGVLAMACAPLALVLLLLYHP